MFTIFHLLFHVVFHLVFHRPSWPSSARYGKDAATDAELSVDLADGAKTPEDLDGAARKPSINVPSAGWSEGGDLASEFDLLLGWYCYMVLDFLKAPHLLSVAFVVGLFIKMVVD